MGNYPEALVAPLVIAEFQQNAANIQKALEKSGFNNFVNTLKENSEKIQNAFAHSPAIKNLIQESQDFAAKLKAVFEKSEIAKLAKQINKTFAKVKTWAKKLFVKYLLLQLPLAEIPKAQIQPSSGKALKLPNSFRSHSPPFYSVIK